jgi:hypothetical protein
VSKILRTHSLLLQSILLLLAAVAAPAMAAKEPAWVNSPPADDTQFLYGVGEGDSRDTARAAALAEIAGTLMTAVESSIQVSQTLSDGQYEENVKAEVATQVRNTEFSNYQVLEAKKVSKRWWVLVQLSRTELIGIARARLNESDQSLNNTIKRLQRQSLLEQYLNKKPAVKQLEATQANLALLRTADMNFSGNEYTDRYLDYEDYLARIPRKVNIRVKSDNKAQDLASKLVNLFADQNIKAATGNADTNQSGITITSEIKDFKFDNVHESRVVLRITTLNEQGEQLASVVHTEVGSSLTSAGIARKQTYGLHARNAEEQGVFRFLGLKRAR